jgi:hypothetical protein
VTALNLWTDRVAAYFLTDTAAYDRTGVVAAFDTKVAVSSRHRIAIARNGAAVPGTSAKITAWLEQQSSQYQAIAAVPGLIASLAVELRETRGDLPSDCYYVPPFSLYLVAAWSIEHGRPLCCVIANGQAALPPKMAPGMLHPIGSYLSPPVVGQGFPSSRRQAARFIQAQRLQPDEMGNFSIGGCAELTTVDADGARTELLHAWPDKINRPIRPRWYERLKRWADVKASARRPQPALVTRPF